MADNLTTTTTVSTIPSGSIIATDDAGAGGHVQLVKLAISTDGSATALTADNTDGLLVNLGGNNDVTLTTLPDTAAGDLAAINTAVSGTLTVDLGANNDVTIDNSSIVHLEDAVHATGDAGIMSLAVRNDTLAALAGTDGDYAPLQVNGSGALYVDGSGSTQPISGTVTANLSATDNAVLDQIEVNTSFGDSIGGGTEAAALRVTIANDSTGVLSIDDNGSTISIDDGGGAITVDGTVTANLSATDNAVLDSIDTAVNGTLTVSGTVTANLGATDNAVLDQIELNTSYGDNTGGGVESGALRVTLANDSTGLLSVDDNGGSLTIDNDDTVSSNNSTTSTLGISGNFTGTGDDCLGYSTITITLDSSHDSATDGMTFEFSTDNTNWDDVYQFTYTAANGARRFQFPVTARYFRVNYTNGGTGQTHFRVQTILHRQNSLTSVHRLVDNVDPDRSAQVVKSAIIAQAAGSGDFVPVQSTAGGNLKVSIEEVDATNLPTNTVQLGGTAISMNTGTVDAGTQRVTLATDDTVTVDNGGTFAVQVDAALPTGANTIGEVSIGAATTAAGDLAKAEDAAHTTGDVGVMALAVRNDGGTALAGTSGDYIPLGTDSSGNLYVNVAAGSASGTEYTEDDAAAANPAGPTLTMVRQDTPATLVSADGDVVAARATNYGAQFVQVLDSSGNFINAFGGSGGTSHADDAAFSIGGASSITPTGYLADETTPDSVDEGDVGVPRMTLTRKPYAVITDATSENNAAVDGSGHLQVDIAADSVGIGGGTQYAVDDALGATPTGTLAVAIRDDALSALTPVEGDAVGLRVDSTGALWVTTDDTITVTDNGSFTLAANDGVDIGDVTINNASIAVTSAAALDVSAATVTVDSELPSAAALADNAANPTAPAVGAFGMVWDGSTWDRLPGTSADGVTVNLGTNNDVTVTGTVTVDNAGTFAVQEDGAALTALQLIDDIVVADDAAFTPGTTKVAMVGATFDDVTPDSVDEGDGGALRMSANRNLYTMIRDGAGNERGANVNANSRLEISIEEDNVGIGGGTQYAVDTALGATPTGTLAVAIRDDALSALTPVEGDAVGLRVDSTGALWIATDDTITVDGSGVTQPVSGTVTANLSATDNAVLDQIEVNTSYGDSIGGGTEAAALRVTIANDSTGLVSVDDGGSSLTVDNAALSVTGGGTEATALRVTIANDSTGLVSIDDGGSTISIDDGAGSITVDGTITASNTAGDIAHSGPDSGNPVKVGGVAYNFDGTAPGTAVTEADRAEFATDVYGRQFVETTHPNYWSTSADYASAQTNATVKAAPGAGLKLYVTDIMISNGATAGNITLLDGSGGTVLIELYPAINGGLSTNLRTPIALTANTLLALTSTTVTTHSVFVSGYIAP